MTGSLHPFHDDPADDGLAHNTGRGAPSAADSADAVLDHIRHGGHLIVPLGNGEPVALLDAIEAAADRGDIDDVTVHQMHALRDRPYLHGEYGDRLRHVSYFLSPVTRSCFRNGTVDLVPNHFSEVFSHMQRRTTDPLVIACASPPDRHGYFSLGVSADYTASFIGRGRFFLEVNEFMPRTFGRNQIHISQIEGWYLQRRAARSRFPRPRSTMTTARLPGTLPNASRTGHACRPGSVRSRMPS